MTPWQRLFYTFAALVMVLALLLSLVMLVALEFEHPYWSP